MKIDKFLISSFILLFSFTFGNEINSDSIKSTLQIPLKEKPTIEKNPVNHIEIKIDGEELVLSINDDQLEEVLSELKNEKSIYEFYILPNISSIIAIIVVIITSIVSISNVKKQLKADKKISEEKLTEETERALENIANQRMQMKKSNETLLKQVQTNNIQQARIKWIENLRSTIANYLGAIHPLKQKLYKVSELIKSDQKSLAKTEYDKLLPEIGIAKKYSAEIKLFLTSESLDHHSLLKELKEIENTVLLYIPSKDFYSELNESLNKIEDLGRIILKSTWEESKG